MEVSENTIDLFELTWFGRNLKFDQNDKFLLSDQIVILGQPDYDMSLPVNWLDDPYNHRSWRWILNAFQWMDSLLAAYKTSNNVQLIEKAAVYFFDWVDFYITKEQDGEFLWKDDAVSFRVFRLGIIAHYILHSTKYTEAQKSLTLRVLQKHYLELSIPNKFKSNNHGIFQMRALAYLITLHPQIADVGQSKSYAIKRLNWLWLKQYGKQNLHLENSTGYHQYIVEEFDQILDSPEFVDCNFVFNKQSILAVRRNAGYLFHPNGIATLFGDSNYVEQKHEITTGHHIFNEAGYAFLAGKEKTQENSYLAIRTGFPSNAHRHADDFTFEWSEKGQIIFQDSGRYSYDYEDAYRKFVSSTRAHNTVTVNDSNYPWWGEFDKNDFYTGAVTNYHYSDKIAELTLYKKFESLNVNFERTFEIEHGKSLRVVDVITSTCVNTYEQWFHLAENFDYQGTDSNGRLIFQSDKIKIQVIPTKGSEVMVVRGQSEPYLQGWVSYSEKKIKPRWSFGFKVVAQSFRFNTKILVS